MSLKIQRRRSLPKLSKTASFFLSLLIFLYKRDAVKRMKNANDHELVAEKLLKI